MSVMHTHPDPDVLHQGCPGCIARVRADQRAALLDESPVRRCTWFVAYESVDDDDVRSAFSMDVRVPAGWTGDQVDEEYAPNTSEAFVMSLPDSYTPRDLELACETFRVVRVVIGAVIPDTVRAVSPVDQPDLFTEGV